MFLIAILAISTINSISAATITIDPSTPGGLKKTVESAKDGDTICLKDGVYKGDNNTKISISKSITIQGIGSNVVINGHDKNYFFNITGKKVLLKKLKITNGYSKNYPCGGAIFHEKGSLTLNDCIFTKNKAKYHGGAILSWDRVTVNKCTFTNNQAQLGSGAISAYKLTVNSCTFTNNQAKEMGSGAISATKLTVNGCTFTNNQAKYHGGAISCSNGQSEWGSLTVRNSIFTNNKAKEEAGAIFAGCKSTVSKCTFTKNQAQKEGGAIDCEWGSLTLKDCIFTKNQAEDGGAINTRVKITVSKCTFTNNKARNKDGGAIDFRYGSSSVNSCTFKNNQAKRNGGAISIGENTAYTATVKIANSKFTKNIGGKVYNAIYAYRGSKFTEKNVSITPKFGTKVKK